jgi:hypothetical protein
MNEAVMEADVSSGRKTLMQDQDNSVNGGKENYKE